MIDTFVFKAHTINLRPEHEVNGKMVQTRAFKAQLPFIIKKKVLGRMVDDFLTVDAFCPQSVATAVTKGTDADGNETENVVELIQENHYYRVQADTFEKGEKLFKPDGTPALEDDGTQRVAKNDGIRIVRLEETAKEMYDEAKELQIATLH
jgi:hypothetical protein